MARQRRMTHTLSPCRDRSEAQIYSLRALYDRPARGRGRDQLPSCHNDR